MRLKVFLRVYGIIILLAIILILSLFWDVPVFRTFVRIAFLATILISTFLSDTRYIQNLIVENQTLKITYVTQFLKIRHIEIPLEEITDVKFPGWTVFSGIWPPSIFIKFSGDVKRFLISDKQKYEESKSELASFELLKSLS
jgi:hypothetical protein